MTREERDKAIRILQWLHNNNFLFRSTEEDVKFATEYAIEALEQEPKTDTWSIKDVANTLAKHGLIAEQEPCEDAVSRQAVIDILDDMTKDYAKSNDFEKVNGVAWVKLQKLQSVNPQKIGHWIADVDKWGDIVTTVNGYRCNKCNTFNADKDNYCPNCGCHMIEPQESEE